MPKIHTFPNEENILKQIKEEYKEGFEHVRSKREIKQKELKDYERVWNRKLLFEENNVRVIIIAKNKNFYIIRI